MRYVYSLVLIFVLTSSGICQGIILPGEVKAGAFPFVTITAQTEGKTVRWFFDSPYLQFLPLKIDDPKSTVIMLATSIPKGRYKVWAYTALNGEATAPAMTLIVVGEGPEPGPGPTPPGPGPGPTPIPDKGFRVLIVYESADTDTMPKEQVSILYDKSIRDYLNAKCATGPDNKTKEWRIWDKDVDGSADSEVWAKALARPRESLPWIIISTGTSGYEGPLPANATKTMELLKKYGG